MVTTQASTDAVPLRSALVVDDHPLYCDALVSMMETVFSMRRVRKAATLGDAVRILRNRFSPDVVILDLKLPDVTGLSGFLTIKGRAPDVPVVVISAITSDSVVHSVMEAGAAGFISKDSARETLRDALIDISEGKTYVPRGYETTSRQTTSDPTIADISRKIAALSHQQLRILTLICEGKPNKVIAYEMSLAEATVKAHITALLRRLSVRNRTQAALLMREVSVRQDLQ